MRRGGVLGLDGGRQVVWAVADGTSGRRWRSVTTHADGQFEASLLVETRPGGGLVKLELATGEGLLTLHPDGEPRRLHGNVVRPSGVSHVALPWSDAHALLVRASPISAAVAVSGAASSLGVGEGAKLAVVEVGDDLRPRPATWHVARTGDHRWWLLAADGGPPMLLETDRHGLPTSAPGASWPLELGGG